MTKFGYKGLMQLCGVWYNAIRHIVYPTTQWKVVVSYVGSSGACASMSTSDGPQVSFVTSSGSVASYVGSY